MFFVLKSLGQLFAKHKTPCPKPLLHTCPQTQYQTAANCQYGNNKYLALHKLHFDCLLFAMRWRAVPATGRVLQTTFSYICQRYETI
jgi:hypothetical protein